MLLTKIWGSLLAFLAAMFLAGMFLLSLNTGGFSDADRAAIRAVTEAGLAALRAEVSSSPTQRAPVLLLDPRLKEALAVPIPEGRQDDPDAPDLDRILAEVAEDNQFGSLGITVGLADDEGQVLASHGNGQPTGVRKLVQDAVDSEAFRALNSVDESLFSATLDGRVHVVKVSPAVQTGHRLLAIQELATGAGSSLRRVLGTDTPAGLVLGGRLTGEIIGDLEIGGVIETLAQTHGGSTPENGASEVYFVGEGLNARIGALGRVPGPAGQGANAVMLAVVSRNTAAAGKTDLAQALDNAVSGGQLSSLQWPVLIAILVLGVALALYLPHFEAVSPLSRLRQELLAIAEGSRHQVFQERYSGPIGEVARAANAAQEAIHAAYLVDPSEDLSEDVPAAESQAAGSRPQMRTARVRRPTRRLRRATGVRAAVSATDGSIADASAALEEDDAGASSSGATRPPPEDRVDDRSAQGAAALLTAESSASAGSVPRALGIGKRAERTHESSPPDAATSIRAPVQPPPLPAPATASGVRPSPASSSSLSSAGISSAGSSATSGRSAAASSSFPQPSASSSFPQPGASASFPGSRSGSWAGARSSGAGPKGHSTGGTAPTSRPNVSPTPSPSRSIPSPSEGGKAGTSSSSSRASASLASVSRSSLGAGPPPLPSSAVPPRPPPPPGASSSAASSFAAPSMSQALDADALQVREIFEEFVQVKMACGEPVEGFTFEKFAAKLSKNREQLLRRPGVKDVHFTVYVKDGKAALKAKVVKE